MWLKYIYFGVIIIICRILNEKFYLASPLLFFESFQKLRFPFRFTETTQSFFCDEHDNFYCFSFYASNIKPENSKYTFSKVLFQMPQSNQVQKLNDSIQTLCILENHVQSQKHLFFLNFISQTYFSLLTKIKIKVCLLEKMLPQPSHFY